MHHHAVVSAQALRDDHRGGVQRPILHRLGNVALCTGLDPDHRFVGAVAHDGLRRQDKAFDLLVQRGHDGDGLSDRQRQSLARLIRNRPEGHWQHAIAQAARSADQLQLDARHVLQVGCTRACGQARICSGGLHEHSCRVNHLEQDFASLDHLAFSHIGPGNHPGDGSPQGLSGRKARANAFLARSEALQFGACGLDLLARHRAFKGLQPLHPLCGQFPATAQLGELGLLVGQGIGLGVMGWADLLFRMRLPYDSKEACELAAAVMGGIQRTATRVSEELGAEKGVPETLEHLGRRNATLTCIAPTGTIALLAGCSSGIEPLFALEHTRVRTQTDGTKVIMKQVNRWYEEALKNEMPEDEIKRVFVTSHEVSPAAHVRTQGVFQRYTDLAVSKTVNLRHECSVKDVLDAYTLAWHEGCKGITVYRDGSKSSQVLYRKEDEKAAEQTGRTESEKIKVPVPAASASASTMPRFVLKRKNLD